MLSRVVYTNRHLCTCHSVTHTHGVQSA